MSIQIGKKIKTLRLGSELTQEELANRAKLTKGFISQLENDKFQTSISLESLSDIVDALGVSLAEFFTEKEDQTVIYKSSDRIPVEGTGASVFELLIPGSTNNQMDPIKVELKAGEKLEQRDPHAGEQFGFILKGNLSLYINKKKYIARKNNCFYFTSDQPYQLLNESDKDVTFLWVTTPPQM